MSYTWYHLLHMIAAVLFVAVTFAATLNPDQKLRKYCLRNSGILAVIVLVTGFGMLGITKAGFPLWAMVKAVCWFVLSIITALAFRQPERADKLKLLTIVVLIAALTMVELKPF